MAPSEFSRAIIDGGKLIARAAAEQGGIISGDNPTAINLNDPLRIWIIQVLIIIGMTQLLSMILGRIHQPRVIAEVIGGVLLGPTVMGRIPRFSQTIFPPDSLPFLNLTATIGLVFYLFLVGLEIDTRVLKRNAKTSGLISLAGLVLPFGLGAAIAVPIYHQFINPDIGFGLFLLFVGVAVAITAFPVLCRILTELNLLDTDVGIITLSAGIGNDVVGWILLALTVTLANASSGLTALWILLASTGWTLFMLFPVRWAFVWLARRTGSLENGAPTPLMMTVTFVVVLISSFMTDVLGVHAIFGGFIAGLIIPHEGGFAIAIVEKTEDLVSLLFIPLYFALSGLKTNMGLLDTGITWGYVILICVIAFFGKFLGCAVTARLCGEPMRESATIGVLMSCKGLVELIVLNIGLSAGILDTRVFSMFVLHALILTFMTTPLTVWLYPEGRRVRVTGDKRPSEKGLEAHSQSGRIEDFKTSLSMVLHRVEQLPAVMSVMQLLQSSPTPSTEAATSSTEKEKESSILKIDGLRLVELSARTSAVMRNTEADELLRRDTLISVFRTFGHFNRIPTTASLAVVAEEAFPSTLVRHAQESGSDLVIIPWTSNAPDAVESSHSPFESIFGKSSADQASSVVYSHFVRKVFHESPVDTGLFVDRGVAQANIRNGAYGHHIVVPFFGGPDDRLALSFVVQLCTNASTTATVIRIRKVESVELTSQTTADDTNKADLTVLSTNAFPDTIYGHATTEHRLASETADNLAWGRFANPAGQDLNRATQEALTRINFTELSSATPLHAVINQVAEESKKTVNTWRSLLVITGRARRMAVENHHAELRQITTEHSAPNSAEISRTMGDVAGALFISGSTTSMIVMQAASD